MTRDSDEDSGALPAAAASAPLITCLCVTHDRVPMLRRAVACFLAQTHPNRELLVLHEAGDLATAGYIASLNEPSIRTMVVPALPRLTLGAKRNIAIAAMQGDYMAVWDDDDWHGPQRLAIQLQAIELSGLPACTLNQVAVWDQVAGEVYLSQKRHWECTLLTRRAGMPPYADLHTGGDVPCVLAIQERGQLCWANAPHLYIYIYHGRNIGTRAHFRRNIFVHSQKLAPAFARRVKLLLDQPLAAPPLAMAELQAASPLQPHQP